MRFENATCGRKYFKKYAEKISVLENSRLRVDGVLETSVHRNTVLLIAYISAVTSHLKLSSFKLTTKSPY